MFYLLYDVKKVYYISLPSRTSVTKWNESKCFISCCALFRV